MELQTLAYVPMHRVPTWIALDSAVERVDTHLNSISPGHGIPLRRTELHLDLTGKDGLIQLFTDREGQINRYRFRFADGTTWEFAARVWFSERFTERAKPRSRKFVERVRAVLHASGLMRVS